MASKQRDSTSQLSLRVGCVGCVADYPMSISGFKVETRRSHPCAKAGREPGFVKVTHVTSWAHGNSALFVLLEAAKHRMMNRECSLQPLLQAQSCLLLKLAQGSVFCEIYKVFQKPVTRQLYSKGHCMPFLLSAVNLLQSPGLSQASRPDAKPREIP